MDDKDFIKALECCTRGTSCAEDECPIYRTEYCLNPVLFYEKLFNIIVNQREEIERLTARDCPDCTYFVGCEAARRGRPCDLFKKKGE